MIAAATFGVLIYAGVGLRKRQPELSPAGFGLASGGFAALVFAQLGLGALVAGLRAGLVYNSWPLMDGHWIPPGAFGLSPWPRSIVDDVTTAQFDHRIVAYAVVAYSLAQAFLAWRSAPGTALAHRAIALAGLALGQAALGVATLLFVVPIGLALAHQALALTLFGMAMAHAGATSVERAARCEALASAPAFGAAGPMVPATALGRVEALRQHGQAEAHMRPGMPSAREGDAALGRPDAQHVTLGLGREPVGPAANLRELALRRQLQREDAFHPPVDPAAQRPDRASPVAAAALVGRDAMALRHTLVDEFA